MDINRSVRLMMALAIKSEGVYLTPYLCPAGVPTIAVGATFYKDGTIVKLTDPAMTKAAALDLLEWMVRTIFLPKLLKLCPCIDTDERLAAILDFVFNLGAGALASSTLRKRINAGDWDDVPAQLRKWVYGGGKKLGGLVKRREEEIKLLWSKVL
jgi:lysozyme